MTLTPRCGKVIPSRHSRSLLSNWTELQPVVSLRLKRDKQKRAKQAQLTCFVWLFDFFKDFKVPLHNQILVCIMLVCKHQGFYWTRRLLYCSSKLHALAVCECVKGLPRSPDTPTASHNCLNDLRCWNVDLRGAAVVLESMVGYTEDSTDGLLNPPGSCLLVVQHTLPPEMYTHLPQTDASYKTPFYGIPISWLTGDAIEGDSKEGWSPPCASVVWYCVDRSCGGSM